MNEPHSLSSLDRASAPVLISAAKFKLINRVCTGGPKLDAVCRGSLTVTEQRRIITSLDLLALLLPIQPSVFITITAACCLCLIDLLQATSENDAM